MLGCTTATCSSILTGQAPRLLSVLGWLTSGHERRSRASVALLSPILPVLAMARGRKRSPSSFLKHGGEQRRRSPGHGKGAKEEISRARPVHAYQVFDKMPQGVTIPVERFDDCMQTSAGNQTCYF